MPKVLNKKTCGVDMYLLIRLQNRKRRYPVWLVRGFTNDVDDVKKSIKSFRHYNFVIDDGMGKQCTLLKQT